MSFVGACLLIVSCLLCQPVQAEPLSSPNYRFDESVLGAGGSIQSSSNNFQSRSSAGDLGVGNSSSSNFQVEAGSVTPKSPYLSFSVDTSGSNLGDFSSANAAMATSTFSVINYTSYGYVVQIVGDTPTSSGHTIPAMTSTSLSTPGVEQFGINLANNNSPQNIGADPDNGEFGFGQAAPNYAVADHYRYVSGETIAKAPKSSGETTYTISYMVNVAALTPGGQYTSKQTLIVTGTY